MKGSDSEATNDPDSGMPTLQKDELIQLIHSDRLQGDKKIQELLAHQQRAAARGTEFEVPEFSVLVGNMKKDLEYHQSMTGEPGAARVIEWFLAQLSHLEHKDYPYQQTVRAALRYSLIKTWLYETCYAFSFPRRVFLSFNMETLTEPLEYPGIIYTNTYRYEELWPVKYIRYFFEHSEVSMSCQHFFYPSFDKLDICFFNHIFPFPFYPLGLCQGKTMKADGIEMDPGKFLAHDLFHWSDITRRGKNDPEDPQRITALVALREYYLQVIAAVDEEYQPFLAELLFKLSHEFSDWDFNSPFTEYISILADEYCQRNLSRWRMPESPYENCLSYALAIMASLHEIFYPEPELSVTCSGLPCHYPFDQKTIEKYLPEARAALWWNRLFAMMAIIYSHEIWGQYIEENSISFAGEMVLQQRLDEWKDKKNGDWLQLQKLRNTFGHSTWEEVAEAMQTLHDLAQKEAGNRRDTYLLLKAHMDKKPDNAFSQWHPAFSNIFSQCEMSPHHFLRCLWKLRELNI